MGTAEPPPPAAALKLDITVECPVDVVQDQVGFSDPAVVWTLYEAFNP